MENEITLHVKQKRNTNIECLRFTLMLFIILWHIIMHGFEYKFIGTTNFSMQSKTGIFAFLCTLFSPSVYCFMFISGWFGIRFSFRKLLHFALLGIICFTISQTIRIIYGYDLTIRYNLTHSLPIACYNWWFLTDYIMVYTITPFIEYGFKYLDKKTLNKIIATMSYIEVFSILTLSTNTGSSFYGLLYIYILARYLKNINFNPQLKKLALAYCTSFILLWAICFGASTLSGKYAELSFISLSYNNPLIIIMAAALFFIVKGLRPTYSELLNRLFSSVISIYLITEGIGAPLYKYLESMMCKNMLIGVLLVLLIAIACLIIGCIITYIFNTIVKLFNQG